MKNSIRKRKVLLLFVLAVFCMGGITFSQSDKNERTQLSYNEKRSVLTIAEPGDTTIVEIRSKGIELSYSVTEIRAKAGEILLIRYVNDSNMSHNIVLVRKEEDIRPVGIAALQAVTNDWIPESEMDRILAYSELAHSGDTVEVSFKVPPPGTYPYICTYSAHWTQMQGRLISTE